jgi:hypothetical protein
MSTNIISKITAFLWGEPTYDAEIRQQKNGEFILVQTDGNEKVGGYKRLRDARRGATRRGYTSVLERTDTFLTVA